MNVMIVSQCDKRALTETRRILDQFAERRGDRTWQTPITQDGLDTLRRLLRKTARKNTAVACHWIRGIDHTELLWVVGDRSRFNEQGAVPTNTTERNVLRALDENDWHTGELICLLTDMAGLLHDLGKAIDAFQMRLRGDLTVRNLIRHEWVSLRLLEAFVGQDHDGVWLARLADPSPLDDECWLNALRRDGMDGPQPSPFYSLRHAPLAQTIGWLVVTHHRLPQLPDRSDFQMSMLQGLLTQMQPAWNESAFDSESHESLSLYWSFPHGLPVTNNAWRQRAGRIATRLRVYAAREGLDNLLANPFVMHLSRLSLMLADHHYSSLEGDAHPERVKVKSNGKLIANTTNKGMLPNQTLDEHLVGVALHGAEVARFLPQFENHLPRLGKHRLLRQRALSKNFRWQDKAADLAVAMRSRSQQHGAFIVNMASTGSGKTLANARVMYGLADPASGMRCAFAMGLRTLTLQTGRAFRDLLMLGDDELAIRVGGSASRALFNHYEEQAEKTGSASRQALLEEDAHVIFEGQQDSHPMLRRAVSDPQVRALLVAPLLVCTIDHLTPATESQRGGRQIAPMLRLMSGDLVLDEPDDFDLNDFPALTRLVHWAGLLGSRVLLSSATLQPALVQGLFEAYRNGRQHFQRNRGRHPGAADTPPEVCCAWIDEFHQVQAGCGTSGSFTKAHEEFASRRQSELAKLAEEPTRRGALLGLQGLSPNLTDAASVFASEVITASRSLHERHHSTDPQSGKRVSFGLVRMANIEPLFEVALALYRQGVPVGLRIHLCVYHSQFPLLIRSAIERKLDAALKRHQPDAVFSLADIRERLDDYPESDHLFIVLGSPVTEVGRDHDYDWAVVEPSSMRSLIQLAGRVRRHRPSVIAGANVLVFNTNIRNFRSPSKAAFCRPGFEMDTGPFKLATHDLNNLLRPDEYEVIDARPRIVARPQEQLQPQHRMADLEHGRTRATMLPQTPAVPASVDSGRRSRGTAQTLPPTLNASTWWQQAPADALLTAVLQQQQPFRKNSGPPSVDLVLLPDEEGEELLLHQIMQVKGGRLHETVNLQVHISQFHGIPNQMVQGDGIGPWGVTDYLQELTALAAELDITLEKCATRFGTVTVPEDANGWRFHPALGFSKKGVS